MKTLFEIPKPKGSGFIIWEHLMLSAVAFIGTFALLFFGPMLLEAKSKNHRLEDSLLFEFVKYLLAHPEVHIGLSVLAVIIANAYIVWKNVRLKYTAKIAYDETGIQLEIVNLYYTKRQRVEIPAADVAFYVAHSTNWINEKRQKLVFRNKREDKTIAEINPKHAFWSEHLVQLRTVMQELSAYRQADITPKDRKALLK